MTDSKTTEQRHRTGHRFGEFELIEELGRGGMGVVYRAKQVSLGRSVALKVLPSFSTRDPAAVARFRREAEATAKLSHPGIVPVHGCGVSEGCHWYAMDLVEGPSLEEVLESLLERRPDSLFGPVVEETAIAALCPPLRVPAGKGAQGNPYVRSCAAIAADLASALTAAHDAKIVHRDLKPSNVMLHPAGRPVLVDFGLARDEDVRGLTQTGQAIGTPAYMSPEQATGAEVDGRADVYGLGAVLYEMLALRPPFDGETAAMVMRAIVDDLPPRLSKLNRRVPPDLETIVHKCLEKNPDNRYWSAGALELDLRGFLEGAPIAAQRPGRGERVRRFLARNRRSVVTAAATVVAVGLAGTTAGVISLSRSHENGVEALRHARSAIIDAADFDAARARYVEAGRYLSPAEVLAARVGDLRGAFERYYPDKLGLLKRLAREVPVRARSQLPDLLGRIEGRGRIAVKGVDPVDCTVRRLEGHSLGRAHRLGAASTFGIGHYLVRVDAKGFEPLVTATRVDRDRTALIDPKLVKRGSIPADMALVRDPRDGGLFALSRTELRGSDFVRSLRDAGDTALGRELEAGVRAEPERPARGLSYRQARTVAALLGGHLPSRREFLLAARSGLDGLFYPWGMGFDPKRLIADPDYRTEPEPVTACVEGASFAGILNLLGNVAELLSLEAGGRVVLAGGHYQSIAPEKLRLDRPNRLFQELDDLDTRRPYAGMRIATFVEPEAGDGTICEAADDAIDHVLSGPSGSLLHDWDLHEDGGIHYGLTISGNYADASRDVALGFVTRGFLQVADVAVFDGHGHELSSTTERRRDLEASIVTAHLPRAPRAGQRYRRVLRTDLIAADGLWPDSAGYVLRIPVKGTGKVPVVQRLRLPLGTHIDRVDPEPSFRYRQDGRTVLVWDFGTTKRSARTLPCVVHFRADGMLTQRWPALAPAAGFAGSFLNALASGNRARLERIVDRAFLMSPTGLGWSEVVAGNLHETMVFELERVVDVMAVGPVITVDAIVNWTTRSRDGKAARMPDWPLRLQVLRTRSGFKALRLMPRVAQDEGRVGPDGVYAHARLKLRVTPPPGASFVRTQDQLTAMQVRFIRDASVSLQVVGHFADDRETVEQIRFRMTSGAIDLRHGRRLSSSSPGTMEWIFGRDGNTWSRERWTFLTKGRRHVLVIARAEGIDEPEAMRRFDVSQEWFARMQATLRFD